VLKQRFSNTFQARALPRRDVARTARRPRSPADRGAPSPCSRAPRHIEPRAPRTSPLPCHTDAVRAADRRSIRGAAVRAPAEVAVPRPHLRGHAFVAPAAPLFKRCPPFPPRARNHRSRRPTRPPWSVADELALPSSHGRATARAPSLDPLGPAHAACCPGRALAVVGTKLSRPPLPALAVRQCRRLRAPRLLLPPGPR
jgi:hypothetical protein